MTTFFTILLCILYGFVLYFWYCCAVDLTNERNANNRLQAQSTTGQTIIADSILDYIREESTFLDKDLVISRLRDAMIGLGYYPKDRLKTEPTDDSQPPDS